MTIRWSISIEVGEHDHRKNDLIDAIDMLRRHLIERELRHTLTEERDGRPPIEVMKGSS